ncbi:MAG: DUF4275 family protein [Planctomycetota bacterium]
MRLETELQIEASAVTGAEFRSVNSRLLGSFYANVERSTGKWVYNVYRWHAYTYRFEQAIVGPEAFERFHQQTVMPFYIYRETDDSLFDCNARSWPDVRVFEDDVYVFPHDMAWLFITTHEASRGIGPFFALPCS